MTVSLVVIALTIFLGWALPDLEVKTGRSARRLYIWTVSVVLVLQSGLRNVAVGSDTFQYFRRFEAIKDTTWTEIYQSFIQYYGYQIGKDPGYDVLQKAFQIVLPYYQGFLILIAVIFFSALGNLVYKNTTKTSDAVYAYVLYSCLFYSFFSITGHRQTIATAACLFGYELIKKRKPLLFILLILLASTIHKSALLFLPMYFVAFARYTKSYYLGVLLSLPLLMVYRVPIAEILRDLGGYSNYSGTEAAGTYVFSVMLLVVVALLIWRYEKIVVTSPAIKQVLNIFVFSVLFTPLTWVDPSAMRVVQYYSIFLMLLFPAIVVSFNMEPRRIRQLVYFLPAIVLIALFIRSSAHMEYRFFWQEMALGANYQ